MDFGLSDPMRFTSRSRNVLDVSNLALGTEGFDGPENYGNKYYGACLLQNQSHAGPPDRSCH